MPTIIILLSGAVENQGGLGQEAAVFERPGTLIYSSGAHTLRVRGNVPPHLAEVEIR
jgi:hypothetical protein